MRGVPRCLPPRSAQPGPPGGGRTRAVPPASQRPRAGEWPRIEKQKEKKSLPRAPLSVGPPRPPLPVSRPVTGRRIRDRGGRKRRGRGRGRALGFRPRAPRPGVPEAPAARAPGGRRGVGGGEQGVGGGPPLRARPAARPHPEAEEGGPAAASTSTTAPPAEGSAL